MTEMQHRRSTHAITACVLGMAVLTASDLWSKAWAQEALSRERTAEVAPTCEPDQRGRTYFQRERTQPVVLVDGYLELRYAENCGAAFGMMDEAPRWLRVSLFMTAAVIAMVAIIWMFVAGTGGPLFAWSVPLIGSGVLGNMVDRIQLGYVVDFIRFHTHETWEWPTFNVADSTITVGVALLLFDGLRRPAPRTDGGVQPREGSAKESTNTQPT